MKKTDLFKGIGSLIVGVICLILANLNNFKFGEYLWGISGALIGCGMVWLGMYIYYSRPGMSEAYKERVRAQKIEVNDERNKIVRDKSGRITLKIMTYLYLLLMIIFCILSSQGMFMPFARYAVIGLAILLILQYVCRFVVFNYLTKRF